MRNSEAIFPRSVFTPFQRPDLSAKDVVLVLFSSSFLSEYSIYWHYTETNEGCQEDLSMYPREMIVKQQRLLRERCGKLNE
jgi:hypothetical protein